MHNSFPFSFNVLPYTFLISVRRKIIHHSLSPLSENNAGPNTGLWITHVRVYTPHHSIFCILQYSHLCCCPILSFPRMSGRNKARTSTIVIGITDEAEWSFVHSANTAWQRILLPVFRVSFHSIINCYFWHTGGKLFLSVKSEFALAFSLR